MKKLLYLLWILAIIIGAMCGAAVPAEYKYIVGFIFGDLSLAILQFAKEVNK